MYELTNKVAIVTGGGSGIGRAICKTFAEAGANVCIFEVNQEALDAVTTEIANGGGTVKGFLCDVSDSKNVIASEKEVVDLFGGIDILVNNAGIAHIGTVETTTEDDFDRIFSVNVKGMFLTTKEVIPVMKRRGGGSIINLASVASVVGIPDRFAYSMSKGAVLTMTLSIAKDYLAHNIRCNSIAPARVHTPFVDGFIRDNYPGHEEEMFQRLSNTQPVGRMGTPDEMAALVRYLASDEASFITGTNVPIDGGFITLNN